MLWLIMAIFSALFAGLSSIFVKCGIKRTDSDLATAIRTIVVFLFAWAMVFIVGSFNTITSISIKSIFFLVLSGFSTGAAWISYFKALSIGNINKVVPVDKSSTILTVILAIIIFNETNNLMIKLCAVVLLGVGVFLMIEKKETDEKEEKRAWLIYAIFSAVFSTMTAILAKIGIEGVESNLATAIRTCVILLMAWGIVFAKGKQSQINNIDVKELLFISLSGIATGGSWLCYYYAIQNGIVSIVVPIDKLSIVVSIGFSYFVFNEKLSKKSLIGLILMIAGTLIMAIWG